MAIGLTAVLVAITIPFVGGRINEAGAEEKIASQAVTRLDQMTAAVAAVGGHNGVFPCKSSFAAVNHSVQTALAWKLHVTLGRVGTSMRHQGVMFVGPHDSIDGIAPPIDPRLTQKQLIAQVGVLEDVPDDRPELRLQLRRALIIRAGGSMHKEPSGPRRSADSIRCSFCGKPRSEVASIVAGPTPAIAICNECVERCGEIIAEQPPPPPDGGQAA